MSYQPWTVFCRLAVCGSQVDYSTPHLWECDQTLWSSCGKKVELKLLNKNSIKSSKGNSHDKQRSDNSIPNPPVHPSKGYLNQKECKHNGRHVYVYFSACMEKQIHQICNERFKTSVQLDVPLAFLHFPCEIFQLFSLPIWIFNLIHLLKSISAQKHISWNKTSYQNSGVLK